MNKTFWQQAKPHVLAIALFFLVSLIYCLPAVQGLVINQHDILGWKGMAQQSFEFKEKYGHFPLWTNSMFGGMPAYQIAFDSKYNISIGYLHYLFTAFLPGPAGLFFLSCIGFYMLACTLKLRAWIGAFGAIAYAFASYSAIILAVGHMTKFSSMGYVPALLAGLILLTQKRYVTGFIATLIFATLLLSQNHLQIVYYTLLVVGCMVVAYTIYAIRQKQVRTLLVGGGLALAAAGLSATAYAPMLLPTFEYAKETMRGGRSELTSPSLQENKSAGGLDKDYAFRWSYGIDESLTFILPAYKGGSSGPQEIGEESKAVEALQDARLPTEAINYFYNYLSAYWGEQPGTSGPVYFGALVCLLFIAGLFTVRNNWHKGWLIAATIIGLVLAWGSNFKGINYFLFDHLPLYNKFRAPSMALVIPQLTFAVMGCLALQEIFYGQWDQKVLLKRLRWTGIAALVIVTVLVVVYFSSDFKSSSDKNVRDAITNVLTQMMGQGKAPTDQQLQQANSISSGVMSALVLDRKSLYSADMLRTIVFIGLGALLLWLTYKKKLAINYLAIGLIILLLADLIPVDLRYLSKKDYVSNDQFVEKFVPTEADLQIKQDTGYFRVYDKSGGDPFSDSRAAYHHNSIGGYHPAKLGLYQDLIDRYISRDHMPVLNMLNTRYFIVSNPNDRRVMAIQNPEALGPCWFVKTIKYVNTANEEINALNTFNPKDTVVIDKREQSKVTAAPQYDSNATITLVKNLNDYITYQSKAATSQFAVFSEIYYPHGWKAFIDGTEAPIARVDYALRGVTVPAGTHTIEFRFEPRSKAIGDLLSLVVGSISWLLIIGGIFIEWRNYRKKDQSKQVSV